jgi:hypothetical protein
LHVHVQKDRIEPSGAEVERDGSTDALASSGDGNDLPIVPVHSQPP